MESKRKIVKQKTCLTRRCSGAYRLTFVFLLLGLISSSAFARSDGPKKISVGVPPVYSAIGIYLAKELGFFQNYGLDVDIQIFRGAQDLIPLLVTGKLDAVSSGLTAGLYNAVNGGAGIVLAADSGHLGNQHSDKPIHMIVVSKKMYKGSLTREILRGKTFAVSNTSSPQEIFLDLFLKDYGLTLKDVNIVMVPYNGMITALAGRSAFGAVLLEPYLTEAKHQGVVVVIKNCDDLYPLHQDSAIMFSKEFAVQPRQRGIRFMAAYLQGVRYYNAHHSSQQDKELIFKVLKKYTTLRDPALIDEIGKPNLYDDGRLNRASIEGDVRWFLEHKYIHAAPEFAGLLDDSYVDEALKMIDRYTVIQSAVNKRRISGVNTEMHMAVLQPDRVVEHCAIKPGMSILDIGAGTGLFTFRFAKALGGTGMVYATDIDPFMVHLLQDKVKSDHLNNVLALQVTRDGVDPFYGKHFYDLIFLSNVYYHLDDPKDYFKKLRPFLKSNGRIIIIQPKDDEYFLSQQFAFWSERTCLAFKNVRAGHPIFKRLRPKTREYVLRWDRGSPSEEFKSLLADDLNAMLSDTTLFEDLVAFYRNGQEYDDSATSNPMYFGLGRVSMAKVWEEYALIKWMALSLDEADAFGRDIKGLSDDQKRMFNHLNGAALRSILNLDRPQGLREKTGQYLEGVKSITRHMAAAGYGPVDCGKVLTRYLFLEFKKKN